MIDAAGCWIAPGFVDLHCHLREPGQEYKEDIASGGRAAVAGGFTSIACMANTHPVNDDPAMTDYILDRARQDSPARVLPIAAATRGLEGKVMTEMVALVAAGAVAFSDDGKTIMDSGVMRRVLEYSRLVDVPIIVHCEDRTLVGEGVVNEGPVSTRLGLPGNPGVAEEVHIARDLLLAEATGRAPARGARLDGGRRGDDPARARARHQRHRRGDATSLDAHRRRGAGLRHQHQGGAAAALGEPTARPAARASPTARSTRSPPITRPTRCTRRISSSPQAPPGMIGFETALALVLDLVRQGELAPLELVRRLSTNPARILRRAGRQPRAGRAGRRGGRRSRAALDLRPGQGLLEEPQFAVGRADAHGSRAAHVRGRASGVRRRARRGGAVSATPPPARLALADGTVFRGTAFGARSVGVGEVCFNTSLTGYQEILTDPSYAGQIVVMTYTQIGNVGVNAEDDESERPRLQGFVVKEVFEQPSNWRAQESLPAFLARCAVPGIAGIDTRALVRRIREGGAQIGVLSTDPAQQDEAALVARARGAASLDGRDLAAEVTCAAPLCLDAGGLARHRRPGSAAAASRSPATGWWPTTSASSATSCAGSSSRASR